MLLGVDVGTTHTKVGVYEEDGRLLAYTRGPTHREVAADGLSFRSPETLWRDTATLIREATAGLSRPIEALAISSMGEAGVPLDRSGQPTYPVIPWNDTRAEMQMRRLSGALEPKGWLSITGLFPNPIHSIAKWVWLREVDPGAWDRTRLWLSICNYIGYRLTGGTVMEVSQACRTMAFDIRSGDWSAELIELAGLTTDFLPPVVSATDRVGTVTAEAASLVGLRPGTPVFAGGHDHICAALACGVVVPEVVLDSLGTAEALTLGWREPPDPERAGGFGVGIHVAADHSYLIGGLYSSGGALHWLKELLGVASFTELRQLAAAVEPGAAPQFIAQFYGAGPPFNDPGATGAFVGITPDHDRAHLARAVYDGLALEIRAGIEALERVTGESIAVIRLVGASDEDDLSGRIRASVLGRPLEVARHPDMVTAGVALLAGIGLGVYASAEEAVARTYRIRRMFEPEPEWQAPYEEAYARSRHIVGALRESREGV